MIFAASKRVATATEISAFAAMYAIVVGRLVFGELGLKTAAHSFVQAATRSGLVLFIVAPRNRSPSSSPCSKCACVGEMCCRCRACTDWLFMLLSIAVLIVMGSVLEAPRH